MPNFVKDPKTGLVINKDGDFDSWKRLRTRGKELAKMKKENVDTQAELSTLRNEMNEVKELLTQLLTERK